MPGAEWHATPMVKNVEVEMLDQDSCWKAVQTRDASQDGRFFFGVLTTGVFCRPSCPARRPLRKNVRFYETSAQAEQDGLRPCHRCRPLNGTCIDPCANRIRKICLYIEDHSDEPLKLCELAKQTQMSPFHFQRKFKAFVGLTPKQYQDTARVRKLKQALRKATAVVEAVYNAGFGSSSRVYEGASARLGMTPGQYRQGGKGVSITYTTMESPLGLIMIGATDRGLCFLQFGDSEQQLLNMLKREYPLARIDGMSKPYHPDYQKWMDLLNRYLAGTQPCLDLPLDIRATVFQIKVWSYLQSIPYGEVQSYSQVAAAIGSPKATRAVARACAANRVALVIPCHRVIRASGEPGGYRWGHARKRALIDLEQASANLPGK